ncbi:MAG: ATP-dependent helicase, partial [Paludibacteraceae bacterium]|nr:ATP-dependent helicase [Paludibacteraceae bacterium]
EPDVPMTRQTVNEYIRSITTMVDYARYNLCQTVDEITEVATHYGIPFNFDEPEVALKVMEWGKENTQTVDYTDMVWLPYELSLKPIGLQFDWVFFDEAQDASEMSIDLFRRCFKRGTRFVAVGDENQCINLFAGSSQEAFEHLCTSPNTTVFNLPITYRCPVEVTRFANNIVPEMMPMENAPAGEVKWDCSCREIMDGDMVLARSKSPLVKAYVKLLRWNVNCYIKGQDIASNLVELLDEIDEQELSLDLSEDGVFPRLYDKLFTMRNGLMEKRGLDIFDATLSDCVMSLYDSINTLVILSERVTTKKALIKHITDVFSECGGGVCLSTIHKAKGLEADNVYILCNSTMPSKLATHDWEKRQERNVQYVAYTRAKKKMGFISEKEIKPSGSSQDPDDIMTEL